MNGLRSNIKTPSITKEAKIFDILEETQDGISMAIKLDEMIKEAEIEKNNKLKDPAKESLKDIQGKQEEFIQDSER